jgi:glycosyltransferase involved in cell wall biosynthesis
MSGPRVSVVVNNFNYERYLGEAIDSALAQDHDDVEVVVVDDGSTDGSAEIVASYGSRVVPVLKPNGGQGSAFNAGFAVATGDVVIFLDADDRLAPAAARTVAAAFAADADLASVQYRLQVIDGDGRSTGTIRPRRSGALPSGDLAAHVIRFRAYHWQPTTGNAYAASALARIMPVPEGSYRIEADAFLAELIPFCGPMRGLDDVLGDYRVHGANNYRGTKADAAFFRRKIQRIHEGHALVVARAPGLGWDHVPSSPHKALDAPFIGFRLASLRLDPEDHPVVADRRLKLGVRGAYGAIANRELGSVKARSARAAWLLVVAAAPGKVARRVIGRWTPDVR